jgi:sensor histidine kinase YesM
MLATFTPPRAFTPEVIMADTANLELIVYKLDDLAKQISRMDINQTAALKKLEDRLEEQEKYVRELQDYKLRAQTVTVPLSIMFSAGLAVAVKFALDAVLK